MIGKLSRKHLFILLSSCLCTFMGSAQTSEQDKIISVSMRMIGHQFLLEHGDSTSVILPIKKVGSQFIIEFSADFAFNPNILARTIDKILSKSKLIENYLVEVQKADSKEIVYNFIINNADSSRLLPCTSRNFEKSRYNLMITILDESYTTQSQKNTLNLADDTLIFAKNGAIYNGTEKSSQTTISKESGYWSMLLLLIPILLVVGLGIFLRKGKRQKSTQVDGIPIGVYSFDKINMRLELEGNAVELTGKEVDLLSLLHSSSNQTIEREEILRKVWGDEGDYVGRTLDVFISKLRKKLENDPNVRIANIRGVGYKLVVNND